MLALLRKEIRSFLSSLIGYIVICVFLLILGLVLWIFPMGTNVLTAGYADLTPLFEIAPWVFLFLIPAITMRSFSEEKRTGTIELLMTKPLTDAQVVMAKFLAGFVLVLFAILPTLIYFLSIHFLGEEVGNIDSGGTWGSYVGLVFLGGGFVAIGLFASAITNNQVVAFIVALFLCFIVYMGFDVISTVDGLGSYDYFIQKLGIREHYTSLSRGAVDSRDMLYFVSLIAFFLLLTRARLGTRRL